MLYNNQLPHYSATSAFCLTYFTFCFHTYSYSCMAVSHELHHQGHKIFFHSLTFTRNLKALKMMDMSVFMLFTFLYSDLMPNTDYSQLHNSVIFDKLLFKENVFKF